jgi:DNA-binding Xre family transcriptional regulator
MDNTPKKERHKPISMSECGFKPTLDVALDKIGSSKNALSVESKGVTGITIRPATLSEIASGKARQINFDTIDTIIKTLDYIARQNGKPDKKHTIADIFKYGEE